MAHNISNHECQSRTTVDGLATMSAFMFSTGVAGNIIALGLLEMRRRRRAPSLFQVLVTALLTTDLLGTLAVTPVVLASYAGNMSLVGMSGQGEVCTYFGFSMTFLSLSTLAIVWAMAMERYISIGHPYFYERHISIRCGYISVTVIYVTCILFCVAPLLDFGSYVQYCPGTWCFLDLRPVGLVKKVHTGLYVSFICVMISGTVLCNLSVIYFLVMMHKRRKSHPRGQGISRLSLFFHRPLSMTKEVEHLLLLVFITVSFICCSFPLVYRSVPEVINLRDIEEKHTLIALRMLSFNSIIDPWLFIILSPSVLRFIWKKLYKNQRTSLSDLNITTLRQPSCSLPGPRQ